MNEMSQVASAMLVLVFAAVMLIIGQQYIERRSAKSFVIQAAQASPTLKPTDDRRVVPGN
jgi:hypothetical protein